MIASPVCPLTERDRVLCPVWDTPTASRMSRAQGTAHHHKFFRIEILPIAAQVASDWCTAPAQNFELAEVVVSGITAKIASAMRTPNLPKCELRADSCQRKY